MDISEGKVDLVSNWSTIILGCDQHGFTPYVVSEVTSEPNHH